MVKLKEIIEERRIVTAIDLYLKTIYGADKYYNCGGPAHEVSNAINSSYQGRMKRVLEFSLFDCCNSINDETLLKSMIDEIAITKEKQPAYFYCNPSCNIKIKELKSYFKESLNEGELETNIILGVYLNSRRGLDCADARNISEAVANLEFTEEKLKDNYRICIAHKKDEQISDLEVFRKLLEYTDEDLKRVGDSYGW